MQDSRASLTRREFLGSCMLAPVLPTVMAELLDLPANRGRIERIDLYAVRYPTRGHFKFFADSRGQAGRPAVVVRVACSDGTVGWGQSVPIHRWSYETLETVFIALRNYLAPAVVGLLASDVTGVLDASDAALAPGLTTGMPIARAGLEIALYDLWAKLLNRSVPELWGKKAEGKILLSWTVNPKRIDETEQLVEEGWKRGYRHFNIKVAPDVAVDVELARRVRKMAPDSFLWADANCGYDADTAVEAAKALADVGVDVLEAPLRPNEIAGYQRLKQLGALPILMDEGVVSPLDLANFLALGMADGVAMKPSRCGGLRSARAQIELVERQQLMWLGSGLTDPDISLAATLQLYAAYGLKRPAALNGPQFLTADILRRPLAVAGGVAEPPSGPGLGVEVDEQKLLELVRRTRLDWPQDGIATIRAV